MLLELYRLILCAPLLSLCVLFQVLTSFIEDKNVEDENHECAVYSDLTNHLTPQPCDAKHEWICMVPRGV